MVAEEKQKRPLRVWTVRSLPAVLAGLVSLTVYARTLAQGLTWSHNGADGGDFLAAALVRGVPHPPGYPVYQLLLRAVISVLPSNPARAGNWLSAICAALAVAALADLVRRHLTTDRWQGPIALSAALVWGLSPALWSQAVITEAYALNALIVILLLRCAWLWRGAREAGESGARWLIAGSFLFGIGLGNHLSLVLLLPGLAVWWWDNRTVPANSNPTPRVRITAGALAALTLGLTAYLYLPLAAAGDPPVNWGDPSTPERFWQVVSGAIYRGLPFGIAPGYLPGRLAAWIQEALTQLGGGPWGTALMLIGLWQIDRRDHAWWRLTVLVALAYSVYAIGYDTADSYVYLVPVWGMAALWLAAGLRQSVQFVGQVAPRFDHPRVAQGLNVLLIVVLLALPGISLWRSWGEMDLSQDRTAQAFVETVLAEAEPGAIILVETDNPTFALWYALYGLAQRADLIPINVNLYIHDWYQDTLANTHPELAARRGENQLPVLDQLLVGLSDQHPIYRAEKLSAWFSQFEEHPGGTLIRLVPR